MFEAIVKSCKTTGDYMPAWEAFANGDFYVEVIQKDEGQETADFEFVATPFGAPTAREPMIMIAENVQQLARTQTRQAIRINGAILIGLLAPEAGILVKFDGEYFVMPKDVVAWLRAGIQPA